MELKKALIHLGVCRENNFNHLTFRLQISDGMRKTSATSRRYFVSLEGTILCSVKRIPTDGVFCIEDIIQTQKLFKGFSYSDAPAILGLYSGDSGNTFIIEEAAPFQTTLYDKVNNGEYLLTEATEILKNIYQEVVNQPSEDRDDSLLVQEIEEFFTAARSLFIPDSLIEQLKEKLDKNIHHLTGRVLRTTRDLITRNIIFFKGKPFVVDFDLSRRTHFIWLDVYRTNYYSSPVALVNNQLLFALPESEPTFLNLLFWLSEVALQQKIVSSEKFRQDLEPRRTEVMHCFKKIFPEYFIQAPAYEGFNICAAPEVDGNLKPEQGESIIQLFWGQNKSFSEEASIKLPLFTDGDIHEYDFFLPKEIVGSFRLDPCNFLCCVEIMKIELYAGVPYDSKAMELLFSWSQQDEFINLLPASELIYLKNHGISFRFIVLGDDSKLFLEGIQELEEIRPTILRVTMLIEKQITLPFAAVLNDLILNLNGELTGKKELIAERQEQINEKEKQLNEKNIQLGHQAEQVKSISDKMVNMKIELDKKNEQIDLQQNELLTMSKGLLEKEEQLFCLLNSFSWRLTFPIRWVVSKYEESMVKRRKTERR